MTNLVEFALVPTVQIGQGRALGNLVEADIISRYVKSLSDELEVCSIRHRIAKEPHSFEFVLLCGLGWHVKPPSKQPAENGSRVYIASSESSTLATHLVEALGHWGQVYVAHGHRASKPVIDADGEKLSAGKAGGVHIEPFVLNGVHAELYAQRLESLGRDMGRTISNYIMSGKHGAMVQSNLAATMLPRLARQPF